MTGRRVRVGGHPAVVIGEDDAGLDLQARVRLTPGRPVEVVGEGTSEGRRTALVWSWRLVDLGRDGPKYRGYCLWR
jgi:hypothetical protein